jgi:hypothetical protein
MEVAVWLIFSGVCIFLISYFYQLYVKNYFFRLLCNEDFIESWLRINEWLAALEKQDKMSPNKEDMLPYCFIFEGKWIGSRLWRAWENDAEKINYNILRAKIFFGTNLKTPIESGMDSFEEAIRRRSDIENEINFWCHVIKSHEKAPYEIQLDIFSPSDMGYINKCYSKEDSEYIINKILEAWRAVLKKTMDLKINRV